VRFETNPALLRAHAALVTDAEFSPHVAAESSDRSLLVTASMDAKIKLWSIQHAEVPMASDVDKATTELCHTSNDQQQSVALRTFWHQTVRNLLVTAHQDKAVRLWDINKTSVVLESGSGVHESTVDSVAWSYDGSTLATACRDKVLRCFDVRGTFSAPISCAVDAHTSSKGSNIVWCGNKPYVVSVGFNRTGERELAVFDTRNMDSAIHRGMFDRGSASVTPHFDGDTGLLYLVGSGDTIMRYYELDFSRDFTLHSLGEHVSSSSSIAVSGIQKRSLDVRSCEVTRFLRLTSAETLETVSFFVPRKNLQLFQADLYPAAFSGKATVDCDEWLQGAQAVPVLMNL
jgi:WD40 repeat protein